MPIKKRTNRTVTLIVWFIAICQPCVAQPNCRTQEYFVPFGSIEEAPSQETFGYLHSYKEMGQYVYYTPAAILYGKWVETKEDTTSLEKKWDKMSFSCRAKADETDRLLMIYSNYRDIPNGEILFLQLDYRLSFSKIARILYREGVGQIDKVERFQHGTDQFLLVYSLLKAGDLYELKDYSRPICVERSRLYVYRLSEDYTFTKMLEEIVSTMPSNRQECSDLIGHFTKGSYFTEGGEQFKIHFSFSTTRPVATRNYEKRYVYMLNTKQFVLEYTNFKE